MLSGGYNNFADLQDQQRPAQANTQRTRTLAECSDMVFASTSPAAAYLNQHIPGNPESFDELLQCLGAEYAPEGGLHWVDMLGGQAVAMREAAWRARSLGRIAMQCVDLFDYGAIPLSDRERGKVATLAGGNIWQHEYEPGLVVANAQTVQLDHAPQLITCFQGLQYIPDPLEALCNWYNQLAPGGLLIIATGTPWNTFIDQAGAPAGYLDRAVAQIEQAGIGCATNVRSELAAISNFGFRTLVLQRQAGTKLARNAEILSQSFTEGQTTTTYSNQSPLIDIVHDDAA